MNVPTAVSRSPRGPGAWVISAVLALFFVSGACGLVYEIIWTRLLRLVMGNTLFSITTVLCAFMGGLAAGSYLAGRFIDRRHDPLRVYAVLEAAVGVYCLLLPGIIHLAEPLYRIIYRDYHNAYILFGLIRFLFCGAILLVPATLHGGDPAGAQPVRGSLHRPHRPRGRTAVRRQHVRGGPGCRRRRVRPDPHPGGRRDDSPGVRGQPPGGPGGLWPASTMSRAATRCPGRTGAAT